MSPGRNHQVSCQRLLTSLTRPPPGTSSSCSSSWTCSPASWSVRTPPVWSSRQPASSVSMMFLQSTTEYYRVLCTATCYYRILLSTSEYYILLHNTAPRLRRTEPSCGHTQRGLGTHCAMGGLLFLNNKTSEVSFVKSKEAHIRADEPQLEIC